MKPPTGVIHSVSIYLSDFGAERLEYEKLHGPNIIVQPTKMRDESDLEELVLIFSILKLRLKVFAT